MSHKNQTIIYFIYARCCLDLREVCEWSRHFSKILSLSYSKYIKNLRWKGGSSKSFASFFIDSKIGVYDINIRKTPSNNRCFLCDIQSNVGQNWDIPIYIFEQLWPLYHSIFVSFPLFHWNLEHKLKSLEYASNNQHIYRVKDFYIKEGPIYLQFQIGVEFIFFKDWFWVTFKKNYIGVAMYWKI